MGVRSDGYLFLKIVHTFETEIFEGLMGEILLLGTWEMFKNLLKLLKLLIISIINVLKYNKNKGK